MGVNFIAGGSILGHFGFEALCLGKGSLVTDLLLTFFLFGIVSVFLVF